MLVSRKLKMECIFMLLIFVSIFSIKAMKPKNKKVEHATNNVAIIISKIFFAKYSILMSLVYSYSMTLSI